MTQRSLAALIAINAVLLAALVVSLFNPAPAMAQFGGGHQYLMIAGKSPIRNDQALIYVIDRRTSRVVALLFNSANNHFEPVAGRIVSQDIKAAPRGRR